MNGGEQEKQRNNAVVLDAWRFCWSVGGGGSNMLWRRGASGFSAI